MGIWQCLNVYITENPRELEMRNTLAIPNAAQIPRTVNFRVAREYRGNGNQNDQNTYNQNP